MYCQMKIMVIIVLVTLSVSILYAQSHEESWTDNRWRLEIGGSMMADDGELSENDFGFSGEIDAGLDFHARISYKLNKRLELGLISGYRAYDRTSYSFQPFVLEFIPIKLTIENALSKKESYPFVALGIGALMPVGSENEWVSDVNTTLDLIVGYSSKLGQRMSLRPYLGLDHAAFEVFNPWFKDNYREHRLIRWKLGVNLGYIL